MPVERHQPRLVGRDRELAVLHDHLRAALAGAGSLVLFGGAAGIGKTALAEALCREATERGALALVGHCYDLSDTPPYGPWRELFARRDQDADSLPPPAVFAPDGVDAPVASQGALFTQAEDFLVAQAARHPLVILLDDLHWADPGSLDLLRVLARRLGEWPVLLLATYRADEVTQGHPLAALLPVLVREARAVRLDLRPLAEAALRALTRPRYGLPADDDARLVAYLRAHAEGNPFYVGELLRTLEEEGVLRPGEAGWRLDDPATAPVPPLLRQVIAGRVARLGEAAERLLALAAVIGQEAPLDVWASVAGADEEAVLGTLERAVDAHLLEGTADGARFAHALVREALYERIVPVRRRFLHRRVAEVLLARPAADPDAVAYHFRQAGDPRAFGWLVSAGLRAYQAAAWLTAVERFTAAAALPDAAGAHARIRGWLLFGSVRLLIFSDNARALRTLDEAEPLALAADDRPLAASIRHARGNLLALRGEIRRGVAAMERETAVLEALPGLHHQRGITGVAPATIAVLLAGGEPAADVPLPAPSAPTLSPYRGQVVHWLGQTGRYREALAMGGAASVALDTLDHDHRPMYGRTPMGLGHAHAALGRPVAARTAYARSRAAHSVANDAYLVGATLLWELLLAVLPYQADDLAERTRLAAESERAWERAHGTVTTTPHGNPTDPPLALLEGRWAEADRLARATLAAATTGYAHGAVVVLGVLARQQGEPAAAWARVRELLPAGPATEPGDAYFHHAIILLALAADLALDAGDLATAQDWVGAHGRWLAWNGAVLWQSEHHRLQARLAAAAGDLAAAHAHAEAALARASEPRQPLALLAAQRTLGEVAIAAGRHVASMAHLDAALVLADACAAPYERALTLLALAEARHAAGEHDAGRPALAEAHATFDRLGARPALARAEALAGRPSARVVPPREAFPLGLTAREAEVLGLVAEGATDPAIARALSISVKTVNKHVASILGKTGSPNRAAAAAFAARSGLDERRRWDG